MTDQEKRSDDGWTSKGGVGMRLINADELIKIALEYDDHMVDVRDIMDAPTIDAVPVVRCKECKMWNTEWSHETGDCYCYKFFQFTDPDFFCAGGERREATPWN